MQMKQLIISLTAIGTVALLCQGIFNVTPTETKAVSACIPLPESFRESDLIGTWIGKYFGNVDKLVIRADGMYKQIFSSDSLNFESEWQTWSFEYTPNGFGRLHLHGMRRCDDTDSICNNPGGGLPLGEVAINPCESEYISYQGEVILFVTGSTNNVPKGIVLWQARLAGSDWTWGYQLQP